MKEEEAHTGDGGPGVRAARAPIWGEGERGLGFEFGEKGLGVGNSE
ncbi:hypothetical protein TIFTF001_004678 [Ficus carica]|uniref:Uncharacterized protein n=1 Tax=Ficus carica TaxID=3494 RepID=A0AA88A5B8_FICCA|nr:hypothetical protein TIFTF001_004678 [Ficus carica]